MRGVIRERGGGTNPKPHGLALGLCLGSSICLFKAQGVNRAFISLNGLGQDTTTEKNSCLNPRLFNSQWLFHKNYSSRKGRFLWHQAAQESSCQTLCSEWACGIREVSVCQHQCGDLWKSRPSLGLASDRTTCFLLHQSLPSPALYSKRIVWFWTDVCNQPKYWHGNKRWIVSIQCCSVRV